MITPSAIWKRIEKETTPSQGYGEDLKRLQALPPGYAYCFAFRYVDADICNGGFSQLYSNSTWPLTLSAYHAAVQAKAPKVARILKEVIYYYHRAGRSRFKRQIADEFFDDLPKAWSRSLSLLEDDYFALESERNEVERRLMERGAELFDSPSNKSLERTRAR
jgi:hypothetical protein